jgi:predicted methyltransferase
MRLTELVHDRLKAQLRPGDFAVDATAGNGHDTLLLAKLVGADGRVCSMDVQAAAMDATRERLQSADCLKQVELIKENHAAALATLAEAAPRAAAIVFNLGYLPGSDKRVQTHAADTLAALNASARLLAPGGFIAITAYQGHPGGMVESEAVAKWMHAQKLRGWVAECHDPGFRERHLPPVLWFISPPTSSD